MRTFILLCFCCVFYQQVKSQTLPLVRSTMGISGSSVEVTIDNTNYIIQQSIGQSSVIGTFIGNDYILRQGFIQPNILAKIIDKDIPLTLEAIIYPNPFKEHISISFNEEMSGNIEVQVYDMLGRMVFEKSYIATESLKIILTGLPVSNYVLKVKANKKQFIKKIIKN